MLVFGNEVQGCIQTFVYDVKACSTVYQCLDDEIVSLCTGIASTRGSDGVKIRIPHGHQPRQQHIIDKTNQCHAMFLQH